MLIDPTPQGPSARPDPRPLAAAPEAPESLRSLMSGLDDGAEDLFGNRVEWKFVLEPAVARRLRDALAARLRLEEFVPGRRKTLMHSIYFDSADFVLYRRAVSSQSSLKFRLRTYATHGQAEGADAFGFFECKIGAQGKKYKLRDRVPVLKAGTLMQPTWLTGAGAVFDERFLRKALRVMREYQMAPRLTVSYVREAFVSEDGALRVTFDEDYRAARIERGASSPLAAGPGRIDRTVMEIKFVGAVPPWLAELLGAHAQPLGGVAFSKFRQGVALTYPEVVQALSPLGDEAGLQAS